MTRDVIWTIARKELQDRLRNRWIWTVAALLALAASAITLLGAAPVGVVGVPLGGAALASLMNLTVYLVPLLALILGAGALIDEKRRGTLDLILAYPLSSADLFFGTFLGLALALTISVTTGFAVSGAVLLWAGANVGETLAVVSFSLVLGIVFLALSFLLSILSKDRARAVASSILVWIFAVFVFDLMLVGTLIAAGGKVPTALFSGLLLLNPTDVFRVLCFKWVESAATPLGLSGIIPSVFSTPLLVGILMLWVTLPLLLCYWIFRRRVARDTLV
jgi:Cu-processing system permease protein